jgi:hypothetical protein
MSTRKVGKVNEQREVLAKPSLAPTIPLQERWEKEEFLILQRQILSLDYEVRALLISRHPGTEFIIKAFKAQEDYKDICAWGIYEAGRIEAAQIRK